MSLVARFHRAFGLEAPAVPPLRPDPDLVRLRLRLIREEFKEVEEVLLKLIHAGNPSDVGDLYADLLKELADLRVVTEGCAVSLGLPFEAAFKEVHRSNMTKLGADGKPIRREDGKVLKGPNYQEADMHKLLPGIIDS